MSKEITILHISDLHAKLDEKDKLQSRANALFDDISRLNLEIDLVAFTGDVAFSGKKEEYQLASEVLLEPLLRRYKISPKKVFVIPGNHDVDRELVEPMEETGLRKSLKTSEAAGKAFRENGYASKRLAGYFDFFSGQYNCSSAPFAYNSLSARGFDIGVASLNSAWRCSCDNDKGKLFLTYEQVNISADALDKCALRIALIHHPFEWFHEAESDILEDLKRRFEVILTGHLHRAISTAEQTTAHNSLFLTVPALYAGAHGDGYNVYRIGIEDRAFTANFRKYIRNRNEFDRDTTHARDGSHKFDLPVRDISKMSHAVMIQRITACRTRLQEVVKHQLQVIQKVDNPVLVTPKIANVSWHFGTKIKSPIQGSLIDIAKKHAIIYGPIDAGKTILLETLTADLSDQRASDNASRLALYVELKSSQSFESKEAVAEFIEAAAASELSGEELRHAVVLLDGLGEKHLAVLDYLLDLASERDWVIIASTGSELLFDALGQRSSYNEKVDFFEVSHWGPSRIREFVVKYFEGTGIDVDAAYNFVSASLEDTDIPATPMIVALYLSIFPSLGKQVSSLSFVRLLEKIEEQRLGQVETSAADSLYNKRQILMRLACVCRERGTISVDRKTLEQMIEAFFKEKFLPVDSQRFIASLHDSGLIIVSGGSVKFSYFAFYDYFLARAFERKIAEPDEILTSLSGCLSIGHALTVYGGIFRENSKIAETVLGHVGTVFKNDQEFTTKDLEKYINGLLIENDPKKTADEIVDSDLKKKINYEKYDEEFEKRKNQKAHERIGLLQPHEPTCQIEELATCFRALKTFYNLFRNLENIPGEKKVKFLDQILNFHICSTLSLIQFIHNLKKEGASSDFKTITAYIVTMGGQIFLSSNIGNQSLQETILAALKNTSNDLKRLLLVCLYADLRLHGYQKQLEDYVTQADAMIAVELIYLQTRFLLITHDSLQVPASLISAFQAAFKRRHQLFGEKTSRGTYDKAYSADFEEAKRQHLSFFNAQEALFRASHYG
ncbi:MAG TPA: metallophosphoesterase [Candidatus Limnocylindrales bacterium]|nr:metallophosphoesterase [Candidatus Limnocylindrales bacterium]